MTPTTTAAERYEEHQAEIRRLLNKLSDDLKRHNGEFAQTGRRNWGYPGDLAHVAELLTEACNFLNNEEI